MLSALVLVLAVAADPPAPATSGADAPRLVRPTAPRPIPRPAADRSPDDVRQEAIVRASRGPDGRMTEILGLPRELRPIEQLVADRNVLSLSTRIVRSDPTASPIGFEELYVAPDDSGKLVRGSGGLYATFPYSVYRKTKKGLRIETPAGTIFHIGMPMEWRAAPPTPPAREDLRPGQLGTRVDTGAALQRTGRVDQRVDLFRGDLLTSNAQAPHVARPVATNAPQAVPASAPTNAPNDESLPRIVADESYRRAFLASLRAGARSTGASQAIEPASTDSDAPARPALR